MLRKEVIMRDPSTFDEAVGMAVLFDSLRAFATGRSSFKKIAPRPPNASGPQPIKLGAITDYGQKKYGDKPRYDKPKFDSSKVKCYNCNKLGHISRQCTAPRKRPRPQSQGNNKK